MVAALNALHALNGLLVGDIAAEAIDRIGGIDDDAALAQHFGGALDVAAFEAVGMNGQYLGILALLVDFGDPRIDDAAIMAWPCSALAV